MKTAAILSDDKVFRYALWRIWNAALPVLVVIMLNPSTADAEVNDHTILKLIGFATRLGFGGLAVGNLSAFRATDPKDLFAAGCPPGPMNAAWLRMLVGDAAVAKQPVLCAWGVNARQSPLPEVAAGVLAMIRMWGARPVALRRSSLDGVPFHPLLLPYTCQLEEIPA